MEEIDEYEAYSPPFQASVRSWVVTIRIFLVLLRTQIYSQQITFTAEEIWKPSRAAVGGCIEPRRSLRGFRGEKETGRALVWILLSSNRPAGHSARRALPRTARVCRVA